MCVEKWLDQIRKLDYKIDNLIAQQQVIKDLMFKCTAGGSDGTPHGSGVADKVGDGIARFVDMQNETNEAVDAFFDYRRQVIAKLEQLPAVQYQVLYLHYVRYLSWDAVSKKMKYSVPHVHRIKRDAMKKLEKMIQNDTK